MAATRVDTMGAITTHPVCITMDTTGHTITMPTTAGIIAPGTITLPIWGLR
jgi:hypothetical protein